jgi:hypothetical protein
LCHSLTTRSCRGCWMPPTCRYNACCQAETAGKTVLQPGNSCMRAWSAAGGVASLNFHLTIIVVTLCDSISPQTDVSLPDGARGSPAKCIGVDRLARP